MLWDKQQGKNWLDGGAPFYNVYRSKDNIYYAVGCIEPKFY
jgi:alpha-methylacyl-CoA racemase